MADFVNKGVFDGVVIRKHAQEKDGKTNRYLTVGQVIGVAGPEFFIPHEFKGVVPEEGSQVRVEYQLQTRAVVRTGKTGNAFAGGSIETRVVNITALPAK